MSITEPKLDPRPTALILIDLQNSIVSMKVEPQSSTEIVARAKRLAQVFRDVEAPVVLVTVGHCVDGRDALAPRLDSPAAPMTRPANGSDLIAELNARPTDLRIMKRQWGAFYGSDLDPQLHPRRSRGSDGCARRTK